MWDKLVVFGEFDRHNPAMIGFGWGVLKKSRSAPSKIMKKPPSLFRATEVGGRLAAWECAEIIAVFDVV